MTKKHKDNVIDIKCPIMKIIAMENYSDSFVWERSEGWKIYIMAILVISTSFNIWLYLHSVLVFTMPYFWIYLFCHKYFNIGKNTSPQLIDYIWHFQTKTKSVYYNKTSKWG